VQKSTARPAPGLSWLPLNRSNVTPGATGRTRSKDPPSTVTIRNWSVVAVPFVTRITSVMCSSVNPMQDASTRPRTAAAAALPGDDGNDAPFTKVSIVLDAEASIDELRATDVALL
jgi:hypothetical protein